MDLWYCFCESADKTRELARYEVLLTAEERARRDRFHFERDRNLFLITRVLVRNVLSNYLPITPDAWRFTVEEHGKPRVAHPVIGATIHFNLSNTSGLVVCAVSLAHPAVGVDAEAFDPAPFCIRVAERHFSITEVRTLQALPIAERQRQFLAYWTLKESYIKARGLGFALPLNQFSILLHDDRIEIDLDPRLNDDPKLWRFALLDAVPRHLVAVSARTGGASLSLRARQVVLTDGPRPGG